MKRVLLAFIAWTLVTDAASAKPIALSFDDLPDVAAARFNDPFRSLNITDLSALRRLARLRDRLDQPDVAAIARPRLEAQADQLVAHLAGRDIDAEALLALRLEVANKRRTAAVAVNPALAGETVRLTGYAFPGPRLPNGQKSAYLVEQIGMCSHTPAPPPNQLVRIALPDDARIEGIYVPVEVTGTLLTTHTEAEVFLIDGRTRLESAVMLHADLVRREKPARRARRAERVGERADHSQK